MSNSHTYRIDAIHLFLTYPKCEIPYDIAYDWFLAAFEPCKIVVSQEKHLDSTLHLHVYMKLSKRRHWSNPNFADIIIPNYPIAHGNYQPCRSFKNVVEYVIKGNIYKANFDVTCVKNNYRRSQAEDIIKDGPLKAIEKYPELIFGYKRLKADYEEYKKDSNEHRGSLPLFIPNPWGWVFKTFNQGKRRHLWIFSRLPNRGKTTGFAIPLSNEFRGHLQTGDYTYWNLRGDEHFIILDEYNRAIFKYNELNAMCDGTYHYRIFMGGLIRLKDPLIIILSNQSIKEIYPIMNNLLYARFIEREII